MRFLVLFWVSSLVATVACAGPRVDPFAKVPVAFEPAPGQAGAYFARGHGYVFGIQAAESVLTCFGRKSTILTPVHVKFLRARRDSATIELSEPLASRTNYFLGRNPRGWRTDVVSFGRLRVNGIYSGIDLVYYGGAEGSVEYDFVVHAGADMRAIEFQITGPEDVRVGAEGDLILDVDGREVRWKAPVVYQDADGGRRRVEGGFVLSRHNRVRFRVGDYDRTRDLVIDPTLSYVSYLGGSNNDASFRLATDPSGNVYVVGGTSSLNLPTTSGSLANTYQGGPGDGFIAKFSSTGALIYLSYIGGSGDDMAVAVVADSSGNAYVTGMTSSSNFPVTSGAFQKTFGGKGGNFCRGWFGDAFVLKLNPSGSQLLYSTYLGGSMDDAASAIAIDGSGNAYITGFTLSTNFPTTTGALQTAFGGAGGQTGKPACAGAPWFNSGDAFVTKLNATGTQLVFSTYLGGANDDFGVSLGIDSSQNVYVGGFTLSRNFPVTAGAFQGAFGGTDPQNGFFNTGDGFLAKLSSSGASLSYATYLGGSGDDLVTSLFVASDGSVWATGATSSFNFPVAGAAVQKGYAGYFTLPFLIEQLVGDAFVTHLDPAGKTVLYSTYLGGTQNDLGAAISVDAGGLVYVVGFSDSYDFPVTSNAIQPRLAGDGGEANYFFFGDGFVTVINPAAGQLVYSSYLGGALDDMLFGMALDGAGGLWATGNTVSTNLPVTANGVQKVFSGGLYTTTALSGDSLLVHYANLGTAGPSILTDGTGVINGGSYLPGNVVSGSWVSIKGSGFTSQTVNWDSQNFSTGQLPTSLNGVQVLFNGQPGAVWYLIAGSPQQINVQAPANLSGNVNVQVVVNNVPSNTVTTTAVQVAPAIFPYSLDGGRTFYASAVFLDGTYLGNPSIFPGARQAKAGDKVSLFANSLAPSPAGIVSVSAPTDPVTVTIGGVTFPADFSGLVAPGEFQINITVPSLPASGNFPVTIQIDGRSSQPGILFPYTN
jgi:uncharacterized protein (TIGR03437 family)